MPAASLPGHPLGVARRLILIAALVGLGLAGAWLGTHDNKFALFAGGSMTALLIGVTLGGSSSSEPALQPATAS